MNNKIIVGVEGVSYSGKTTFCENAAFNNNVIIVNESPKFCGITIKVTDNKEEIIKNSELTLQIEEERTKYTSQQFKSNILLFDRTIFSFISISYAYYNTGMVNYYNDYIDQIIDGIKNKVYLVPDYLIYLEVTEEETLKRMQRKKKNLPEYWLSPKFKNSICELMSKIVNVYQVNNRFIHYDEFEKFLNKNKFTKIDSYAIINLLLEMKI
ncbi:predicted protein [Firmicutes bacterium CAG:460]|jgi:predicted kinase|nr:predicted protein [Firmicutes bacterium CAG:460]